MRTISIILYEYSELPEEGKAKALEEHRSQSDFFWADEYVHSLKKAIEFFDFDLDNYNLDYIGSESNLQISTNRDCYDYDPTLHSGLSGVRLFKYLNNQYGKIVCSFTQKILQTFTMDCVFTGFCGDSEFLYPMVEFMKRPYDITLEELIQKCFDSMVESMKADYDHTQTEDYFKAHCEANEYDFLKSGVMTYEHV